MPQDFEIAQDINMSIGWGNATRGEVPCVICSSVIFLVHRRRLLWGVEAMRLQVWPSVNSLTACSHEHIMDLAGNVFCGGCIMGALIAVLMLCSCAVRQNPVAISHTQVQDIVPVDESQMYGRSGCASNSFVEE